MSKNTEYVVRMLKRISRNRYLPPDETVCIANKLCNRVSNSGHTVFNAIFSRENKPDFYCAQGLGILNGSRVFALLSEESLEMHYALRKRKEHLSNMKKEKRELYENLNPIEMVILKITLRRYL